MLQSLLSQVESSITWHRNPSHAEATQQATGASLIIFRYSVPNTQFYQFSGSNHLFNVFYPFYPSQIYLFLSFLSQIIYPQPPIPQEHLSRGGGEGQNWYCSMNNWDDTKASCGAPQEPLWNCKWNLSQS